MSSSSCGEAPAILQLHKWSPSLPHLNLSEYHEGFISPMRQILLLHSYQSEALLLPLDTGCSGDEDNLSSSYGNFEKSGSSAFTRVSVLPDVDDNLPSTSGFLVHTDYDISPGSNFLRSSGYADVGDVNSLAWGVCGDTYNQQKDAAFREFLFICGNQGVTVHAFCQRSATSTMTETTQGDFGRGRWVEWGPSASLVHHLDPQQPTSLCSEDTGNVLECMANANAARSHITSIDEFSSENTASKRWLASFFTKVETIKSDDGIWTRYPGKSSFPCSTGVVSFSIFHNNLPCLNFHSESKSVQDGDSLQDTFLDTSDSYTSHASNSKPDILSVVFGIGVASLYKCSRVFSSNSHSLIGFVVTMGDSIGVDENESRSSKTLLLVAKLGSLGIHWVSTVKLEESLNTNAVIEWMDFRFSDDFLVCLSSSGFIFFYDAMTSNYVTCVDVMQACRLNPLLKKLDHGNISPGLGLQIKPTDRVVCGEFYIRRKFKRLLTASNSSLLAVVDEYGIIYVLSADQSMQEKFHSPQKLLPHFRNSGCGKFVSWDVVGSDIGCQSPRIYFKSSRSDEFDSLFVKDECVLFLDSRATDVLQDPLNSKIDGRGIRKDSCISGFSAGLNMKDQRFQDSEIQPFIMRKVFLPSYKSFGEDSICLSPLGITQYNKKKSSSDQNCSHVIHLDLHIESKVHDDSSLNNQMDFPQSRKESFLREAVGCTFQGCLYLVTERGLSVVLPSISVPSKIAYMESNFHAEHGSRLGSKYEIKGTLVKELKQILSPWEVEVLDRVLLYESIEEADRLCFENGWDLKVARMRWFQMAVHYLNFDVIERSLEMLVDVNLEEEGILRLLFAVVHLIFHRVGNDNEIFAASRLLALATCFATTMVRRYGLILNRNNKQKFHSARRPQILPPVLQDVHRKIGNSRRLRDMAHFLEIIRNLRCRLSLKFKKLSQPLVEGVQVLVTDKPDLLQDELQLLSMDVVPLATRNQHELALPNSIDNSKSELDSVDVNGASALVQHGEVVRKNVLSFENPKEMIARWDLDNLPLKSVVRDALLSGRLPLAVLQLHVHRLRDFVTDKEPDDSFTQIRDIGRAIAYDLFLKGEIELAVATLRRLGEDIELSLKQLFLGTLRRSLRRQIADEMKRYGCLGSHDWKILDQILLIERLYPSNSFSETLLNRRREVIKFTSSSASTGGNSLSSLCFHLINNLTIECGEVDGVVLGFWTNIDENLPVPEVNKNGAQDGYWASAAVWLNVWDQRTTDRILLDQSFQMGVHVLWESQLDYHICHDNWAEVSKLLDLIADPILLDENLQVGLDGLQRSSALECSRESSIYSNYLCFPEELESFCLDIPDVKIFRFSANIMCSRWLRTLMEEKLARKFVFMKNYWEGTAELVPLLARSGFITGRYKMPFEDYLISSSSDLKFSDGDGAFDVETMQALHRVLIYHCAYFNLPFLLDLYLDHHGLVLDNDSLCSLQEAAGDCHWARWLLLSRIKGREYDASFFNARSMTHNLVPQTNLRILDIDEIIRTIDDIAEGGGEIAALATLLYAPAPIQNCLSSGGVNRQNSFSAQCTMENLRPTLQRFPMLWRTLVTSSFGEDTVCSILGPRAKNVLSEYLNWRDSIFFSTGRDTSLLQMLPCWFPKAVRRLIQLYVQGPLGSQLISGVPIGEALQHRDVEFFVNGDEHAEISAISWETTIQKHIEEELYDSSLEESGHGFEHHLHRGRPLSAFSHILSLRVQKLKSEGQPSSALGQTNVQTDIQTLLAPITPTEESLLSSIMPLAIMHYENSMLVASCAFLLELCGLSASMLRVDVAVLKRISSFYKSEENNENPRQLSPKSSAFHPVPLEVDKLDSLAQALADEYLHRDSVDKHKRTVSSVTTERPSLGLMLVLEHLEMVSLRPIVDGNSGGSWLLRGNGDGTELRSQQKAASQYWDLVTVFCRMHELPLSSKYLAMLARDNDWVGFLSEAHSGGYAFGRVIQASKEFSDPRLKIHITTVLKGMQARKKASPSSQWDNMEKGSEVSFSDENMCIPVELFRILAECEKERDPGKALLVKAKELSWSILAMVASCFPDASPLSCLTVWLEITAARETSSIKVNDIASQISVNVGAAVEAINTLPAGSRTLTFHYNRKIPKRRRLTEPTFEDPLPVGVSDLSPSASKISYVNGGLIAETEGKIETRGNAANSLDEGTVSLSKMVALLCEQKFFVPLLRAFEMFLPSCPLLPFIRALQAFSQMRLSEASAHLGSFSVRIKEEVNHPQANVGGKGNVGASWIISTAIQAADSVLSTCLSPYEKKGLLQLLAATDFGDGGAAASYYQRLHCKINLAEPSLREDDGLPLGNETLDDTSLLLSLEKNGLWEQARNWAKLLEASGGTLKSVVHHVTETQAESMVAEWKEFLWDVPEERIALWSHCQTLFIRHSFPPLQAGLFYLKHAEAVEKDLPARELHELLLLSLQWLSGMITLSNPVYPLHLLREIETKVWLLAVESEAQVKSEGDLTVSSSSQDFSRNRSSIIDQTAGIISKMDSHMNAMRTKTLEKHDAREYYQAHNKMDTSIPTSAGGYTKTKRRAKGSMLLRRPLVDAMDKNADSDDGVGPFSFRNDLQLPDENLKMETSFSGWEDRVGPAEVERAVLSLLEFGQVTAAKQLQQKLSPGQVPSELLLVEAALKLAAISTPIGEVSLSMLDQDVHAVILSYNLHTDHDQFNPLQVLENLASIFTEGKGNGFCRRVISVVKAANVLGLPFSEAFYKRPIELLQLLSLKAQESFEEAKLLVQTHSMPAASIAQVLAESFLKGLLAAHRGGYMDSQKEEGPAPLLWRFSDFLKWSELCPFQPEIGHALMRLVITGQEIPHACEVELLILSHHFYKSSACLDGVDVLVSLAATRVEAYVSEGDFSCLARLITGVGNFHALNFILGILIENGQLDLLLQKYSTAADTNTGSAEAVRGFRMAVLTSLKHFNPNDLEAFAMVYSHFDMKHETAAHLESRADQSCELWFRRYDKDQNEDLLDSMRYFIEAAEVYSSIDAGNKTRKACAQASLVSLQIRMPDFQWIYRSETNARRALVEQSRFQEALIVAEAYDLNQPSEWALVLWNQMLKPELLEEFVADFVAVLPLHPSMLADIARFYRAEVAARGDQSQFSVWLTGGGLPADWAKYLGRSFRCLLRRTRDLRLRLQLATVATGFGDVADACFKALDRVPENAGPLVLRKGHGGAYLPLM